MRPALALLLALLAGAAQAAPVWDRPAHLLFDVIVEADPSGLACLDGPMEPGPAYADIAGADAWAWTATYDEGTRVIIAIPSSFDEVRAEELTRALAEALGRVPPQARTGVAWMTVETTGGGSTYSADGMVYRLDEMEDLRARGRLDELMLHNAAHVTFGGSAALAAWDAALAADGFVPLTSWAALAPGFDDMADTVVLAHGLLDHPDRLPAEALVTIGTSAPNRIALVQDWLSAPLQAMPAPDGCTEMLS